ncbi:MAG: hypothetical protein AABW82_00725 [Nanoarchaeota archaeon]
MKIYSKVNPEQLLHIIWRYNFGEPGKMNFMVPETECMQGAAGVHLPKEYTFGGPHKHLPQERSTSKTQESFVVIKGNVEIELYDIDNKTLAKEILREGDCYIYLGGGHAFRILTPESFFYEFKNGPYFGREKDKEFIV